MHSLYLFSHVSENFPEKFVALTVFTASTDSLELQADTSAMIARFLAIFLPGAYTK